MLWHFSTTVQKQTIGTSISFCARTHPSALQESWGGTTADLSHPPSICVMVEVSQCTSVKRVTIHALVPTSCLTPKKHLVCGERQLIECSHSNVSLKIHGNRFEEVICTLIWQAKAELESSGNRTKFLCLDCHQENKTSVLASDTCESFKIVFL